MITATPLRNLRYGIAAWGLIDAWLYCGLFPLWEGFDAPFHYGYVETLRQSDRLPVMDVTLLPSDIYQSFRFAPASHVVKNNLPQTTSFDEWFALPAEERSRRRNMLAVNVPTAEQPGLNYEAHQPPLAYLALALFDSLFQHSSLPVRVLWLRLLGASYSLLLLAWEQ